MARICYRRLMPRIVYTCYPTGAVAGGQKVIIRHVEALRALGFDAVLWTNRSSKFPEWMTFSAPIEVETPLRPDDIMVVPSDAPNVIRAAARDFRRAVVFEQNQFTFAALALEALDQFPAERFPTFIAVGAANARTIGRIYPAARVEIVPCFADERVFRPGQEKTHQVALSPRKRISEARIIRALLPRYHPTHAGLPWAQLEGVSEQQVAQTMAASTLFLSLSRFESVGMTPLEAMACGCVCAGFTGIGGREFASSENGFWVGEDDCEAAADALAEAADLVLTGGAGLRQMQEAGFETAGRWSYARFLSALEATWERLAPEARTLPVRRPS